MPLYRLYEQDTEINDVILFWLTEYLRRNQELQIVRDKLVEEHREIWKEDEDFSSHILYEEGYPPLFSRPKNGQIDDIIKSIIGNNFSPKVRLTNFMDGYDDAVEFKIKNSTERTEVVATIDPNKPKDVILNNISLFLDHYCGRKNLLVSVEHIVDESNNPIGKIGDIKTLAPGSIVVVSLGCLSHLRGMRYNKDKNHLRAIGLWLFDYIDETKSTQTDAIKALEKTGYLSQLDIAPATEELRFYLRRTKECIKAMKLLPFTKKVTQKMKLVPGTKQKA